MVKTFRKRLALLAPRSLKRAHESWSNRRFVSAVTSLTRRYVATNGLVVRYGPFSGLRYVEEAASVGKLVGSYEGELHGVIEELAKTTADIVVDVGSAEGYYAVGLALRLPKAKVFAFDIDESAQRLCAEMAELNGVEERVRIEAACSTERLGEIPETARVILVLDCEGCELDLLRPDIVPGLRRWPILVELHEFVHPDAASEISQRFMDTHRLELIEQATGDGSNIPELAALRPKDRRLALDEHRPARMRWGYLRPRLKAI